MAESIVVLGAGGVLGGGVSEYLRESGFNIIKVSAREIVSHGVTSIEGFVNYFDASAMAGLKGARSVGLILAHRYRGEDPLHALKIELLLTRDFVWALSQVVTSLRVVVLGSVTGSLLCEQMPEAYHYAKDLQKSIVRQSCRLRNVQMNVLSLFWFEKYPRETQTPEYAKGLAATKERLGEGNVPGIKDIADFIGQLMRASQCPRGQVIAYDGGYSILQS